MMKRTTLYMLLKRTGISLGALLSIAVILLSSTPVSALNPQERWHYANIGIEFIDDPCDPTGAGGGTTDLNGKDNIEKAFRFFISKGLSPEQAAGILGNLRQESNVSPTSNNTAAKPSGPSPGSIIPGETWNGGGIAQWEGGRWTGPSGLLNYVAGKGDFAGKPQGDGKSWKVLDIQLSFMWGELTGAFPHNKQPGLSEVKKTNTVPSATIAFEEAFERAGTPNMPRRISLANETLALAKQGGWVNEPLDPSAGASAPGGADTSCSGNQAAGGAGLVDTNGYAWPLAPQKKKEYGGIPCGNAPISYTDKYGHNAHVVTCHHDNTPAADLMDGNGGSAVYALTDGKIINVGKCYSIDHKDPCIQGCSEIQFQANHGSDHYYYWYGHLMNPTVSPGATVKAGQQIAQTAAKSFGARCWGGGPHLHIDRGCVDGNNNPQHGGNDNCREPKFMDDLKKIWDGLKA
jgi:murein DD-endopeptidase MepM/ murein hydrolase activator NlpD